LAAQLKSGCLDQLIVVSNEYTIMDFLKTAFQDLYSLEAKMSKLYEQYTATNNGKYLLQAVEC
jgi:hypothetical protein